MKGAKQLDGKRVRLLVPITTKGGEKFDVGTLGTFCKEGVVRCSFEADDGRTVLVSHRSPLDFEIVGDSALELTELEREVAGRIMRDENPWGPRDRGTESRRTSQALGRLMRKGVIDYAKGQVGGYVMTSLGSSLLAQGDPTFRPSRIGEVGFGGMTTYHCPKHGDVIACACKPI